MCYALLYKNVSILLLLLTCNFANRLISANYQPARTVHAFQITCVCLELSHILILESPTCRFLLLSHYDAISGNVQFYIIEVDLTLKFVSYLYQLYEVRTKAFEMSC